MNKSNPHWNKNNNQNQSVSEQPQAPTNPEPSGIMKMVGQSLPFLPLLFEQFTGQKVPQMSGTIMDIQMALNQVLVNQQAITNSQQQLAHRLSNLENNASQQFTNLISQVQNIQSLRLTHERERKQIEYNNSAPEKEEY